MSEIARKRGIEVVGAIGEYHPFRNDYFDYILMVTTICFLDNVEKALKEVYRTIKPKKCLFIVFIDRNSLIGKIYEHYKQKSAFYTVATFYLVEHILNFLSATGFTDYNFKQTIFHPLTEIDNVGPVKNGYGEGSFIVIKGIKKNRIS